AMNPPCHRFLLVIALQTTFGDPQRLQMILRLGGCGVLPDWGLLPAEHLQDGVPGSALAHHVRHGPSGERALTPSYGQSAPVAPSAPVAHRRHPSLRTPHPSAPVGAPIGAPICTHWPATAIWPLTRGFCTHCTHRTHWGRTPRPYVWSVFIRPSKVFLLRVAPTSIQWVQWVQWVQ